MELAFVPQSKTEEWRKRGWRRVKGCIPPESGWAVLMEFIGRKRTKPEPIQGSGYFAERHVTKADRLARLAEIPQIDTRDLTQRICGDPHPSRSALSRKMQVAE